MWPRRAGRDGNGEGGIVILFAPIADSRDLVFDGAGILPSAGLLLIRWRPREGWIWRLRQWEQG